MVATCFLSVHCAVPVAPTGGPPDRDPPGVESVEPANGAVNVSTSTVKIAFDEYITESSFQQALSVTPEPARRPEIEWSKKTVEVRFREPLEPNTTYLLTIDTKLRDYHGVSLEAPITLAFSTGPEINRGRIRGRVVEPMRGEGVAGTQVFAYPLPDSGMFRDLPERPRYHTETNASGEFQFEYLSSEPYFVLAVQDRNGNRTPDNQEVIALPPIRTVYADSAGTQVDHPWITTMLDTVPPEIRRVEAASTTKIAVRYSEDIKEPAPDASQWSLSDSVMTQDYPIRWSYLLPDDPRQLFLETSRLRPETYVLTPAQVTDSVGNRSSREPVRFTVSATSEEKPVAFLDFIPAGETEAIGLHPDVPVGVLLGRGVSAASVRQWIAVTDTGGVDLEYGLATDDGVRHLVTLAADRQGNPFEIRVLSDSLAALDSTVTRTFSYLTERDLGGIAGFVADASPDTALYVEAFRRDRRKAAGAATIEPSGRFSISQLAEGGYFLRFTRDDNGNGRWDGGTLSPYVPAEPLFWKADSLRVRARWETDIDTLRIPHF